VEVAVDNQGQSGMDATQASFRIAGAWQPVVTVFRLAHDEPRGNVWMLNYPSSAPTDCNMRGYMNMLTADWNRTYPCIRLRRNYVSTPYGCCNKKLLDPTMMSSSKSREFVNRFP